MTGWYQPRARLAVPTWSQSACHMAQMSLRCLGAPGRMPATGRHGRCPDAPCSVGQLTLRVSVIGPRRGNAQFRGVLVLTRVLSYWYTSVPHRARSAGGRASIVAKRDALRGSVSGRATAPTKTPKCASRDFRGRKERTIVRHKGPAARLGLSHLGHRIVSKLEG
jgi:hypothetical protein